MEDEEYLESEEGPVCVECLNDMCSREVVEICGGQLQRA